MPQGPKTEYGAAYSICESMTRAGFMSGFMGDTSHDFLNEQANDLVKMSLAAFEIWVANQPKNMCEARVNYLDVARVYHEKAKFYDQ